MEEAELKEKLGLARCKIQQAAQEFALEYRPESYRLLFVSKREACLQDYLAEPLDMQFGITLAERVQNLEVFLKSSLYSQLIEPGVIHGRVITREELQAERAVIPRIANPALRAEYERLYDKLERHIRKKQWVVLLSIPETSEEHAGLEHTLLHEWLHVLLMDNKISFQARGKSEEWDEGLVTYLMAFLGEEDLDKQIDENSPIAKEHRQYLEAGRRWREILKDKQTPQERKAAIVRGLES